MRIKLEGLEFFAHHGYYQEEQKIGNKYTVDIEITVQTDSDFSTDDLRHTVNYEEVYEIVNAVMQQPTKLLETLSSKINQNISSRFTQIESCQTTVSKHNPPIKGICAKASVTMKVTHE